MVRNNKAENVAIAYLRTSSATNVGADKDSDKRQRQAIHAFAKANGITIVGEYYDAAVSGADPIDMRPGFAQMLDRIAGNGVRCILVETASRFARDLMVQEVGYRKLKDLGITLIAVDSPASFIDDTPTAVMVRQILGSVAQFDKAMIVAKLKAGRDSKRAKGEKVEGRKAHAEIRPEVVALAKRLRRASPKNGSRLSYRAIAVKLADAGHLNDRGQVFNAKSVRAMIEGRRH